MARRAGNKPAEGDQEAGAPAWMVTFADLMTLLLTFFVLLLSMSTLDNQKVKLALGSLRGATAVLEGGGQPRKGRREMQNIPRIAQGEMEIMTTIERVVKKHQDKASNDMIQIGHKDEQVTLALDDSLLFAPGSTEILPSAYPFLNDLSAVMSQGKAMAEFIGHADSSPTARQEQSNWEVASARALSILTYVQRTGPVEGRRLKGSTHGEYQPRFESNSAKGRAGNRRVEIVFTTTSASDRYFYGEERFHREVRPAPADGGN